MSRATRVSREMIELLPGFWMVFCDMQIFGRFHPQTDEKIRQQYDTYRYQLADHHAFYGAALIRQA